MEAFFFWLFSIGLILGGLGVILNRNPVASALSLVVTIVFLAALFVMLNAFFLAAVQILVYAGAVMVLFLFIIMLLDLKAEQKRPFRFVMFVLGLLVALLFCYQIALVLDSLKAGATVGATLPAGGNDVPAIGTLLFTQYLLPFEITSVLLLVATVGVILISRKEGS